MPTQLPLFVYGSLVRGGQYHDAYIAGRFDRVEIARLRGFRRVVGSHGWFVARRCVGESIDGELYFFKESLYAAQLARCDELEELAQGQMRGEWYQREIVPVEIENGVCDAWAYTEAEGGTRT